MSTKRKGEWTGCYSGKKFWVLDPRPEEVTLEDIAHPLSNICRFNGHTKFFYSVAQHSLGVYSLLRQAGLSPVIQLKGLLHDASEAYFCDMPKPIKPLIPTYKDIEAKLEIAIYEHFGLSSQTEEEHYWIKMADNIMLTNEARALMINIDDWNLMPLTSKSQKIPIKREWRFVVKHRFIRLCKKLIKEVYKNVSL